MKQILANSDGIHHLVVSLLITFQVLKIQTNWFSSGLGAHLTWTVPFAFLIMLGVFNRFNPFYEEAAKDLGAGNAKTFQEVVLPPEGVTQRLQGM